MIRNVFELNLTELSAAADAGAITAVFIFVKSATFTKEVNEPALRYVVSFDSVCQKQSCTARYPDEQQHLAVEQSVYWSVLFAETRQ